MSDKPLPEPVRFVCRYCKDRFPMLAGDLGRCQVRASFGSPDEWEGACSRCRAQNHPNAGWLRCVWCESTFECRDSQGLRTDPTAVIREHGNVFEYWGTCPDCRMRAHAQVARRHAAVERAAQTELQLREIGLRMRWASSSDAAARRRVAREAVELLDAAETAYRFPAYHRWLHSQWPCGEVLDLVREGHLEIDGEGEIVRVRSFEAGSRYAAQVYAA